MLRLEMKHFTASVLQERISRDSTRVVFRTAAERPLLSTWSDFGLQLQAVRGPAGEGLEKRSERLDQTFEERLKKRRLKKEMEIVEDAKKSTNNLFSGLMVMTAGSSDFKW